jgi:putative ABC transport system ATP-binding protein
MSPAYFQVEQLSSPRVGPVSFALERGECMAVMGVSGAGKTVLLRLVADLDPGEGRVVLNGASRDAMPAAAWRRRVAYVPAASGWWAPQVAEHFAADTNVEAKRLCAAMRLPGDVLERPVAGLSTGERQRLALVRALVQSPEVLLLDEPTSGLDAATAEAVEACLREAQDQQETSLVLVTHDPAQAARMANQRYQLEQGRLVSA